MRLLYLILAIVGCSSGCQSFQSGPIAPALSNWGKEKQIKQLAQNDPFPSPQQVGLK